MQNLSQSIIKDHQAVEVLQLVLLLLPATKTNILAMVMVAVVMGLVSSLPDL